MASASPCGESISENDIATADPRSTGSFARYHERQASGGRPKTETARVDQTQMTQRQPPIRLILFYDRECLRRRMISMSSGKLKL